MRTQKSNEEGGRAKCIHPTCAGLTYLERIMREDERVETLQTAHARKLPQAIAGEHERGERPRRRSPDRKVGGAYDIAGGIQDHQAGEWEQRLQRSEAVARLCVGRPVMHAGGRRELTQNMAAV